VKVYKFNKDGTTSSEVTINPMSCKFFILSPSHFRENGTCMCDDAEHRELMIKEWGYSEEEFLDIPLKT